MILRTAEDAGAPGCGERSGFEGAGTRSDPDRVDGPGASDLREEDGPGE
jgi:hypothetical protein